MSQKDWIWPKHSCRLLGHFWLLMLQCDRYKQCYFCEEQTLAVVLASLTTWCGHSCNLVHMNPECRIEGIHLGFNQRPRPLLDKQPAYAASSFVLGQIPVERPLGANRDTCACPALWAHKAPKFSSGRSQKSCLMLQLMVAVVVLHFCGTFFHVPCLQIFAVSLVVGSKVGVIFNCRQRIWSLDHSGVGA